MSAIAQGRDGIMIGGRPAISLMPPEIHAERRGRVLRRRAVLAMFLVFALVAAGVAYATYTAVAAQVSLAAAQTRTTELLHQQRDYADVAAIKQQIATGQEAQKVIGSTEIDWQPFILAAIAKMPAGVALTELSIEQATPMTPYVQSADPLQGPRVATFTFTAVSPSFISSADVIDNITSLPGYIDAQITPAQWDDETSAYKTTVAVHIGTDALSNRFPIDGGDN